MLVDRLKKAQPSLIKRLKHEDGQGNNSNLKGRRQMGTIPGQRRMGNGTGEVNEQTRGAVRPNTY